jgi:hypothetical protein
MKAGLAAAQAALPYRLFLKEAKYRTMTATGPKYSARASALRSEAVISSESAPA